MSEQLTSTVDLSLPKMYLENQSCASQRNMMQIPDRGISDTLGTCDIQKNKSLSWMFKSFTLR